MCQEWRTGFKNLSWINNSREELLVRLCLSRKAVGKVGGTGFVRVGHCPAGTDGRPMATGYL